MPRKIGYHNLVLDTESGIGLLATVTVYLPGTNTVATVYSTYSGGAKSNPFTTDSMGRFSFYADPGEYDVQISGVGIETYKLENVSIIGEYSIFVTSQPGSGEHRVKKIRLDATDRVTITYDGDAEP